MAPTAPPTSHTIVERAFTRNRKALSGVMPPRSPPFAWCPGALSAECVRNRLERGARVGANRTYGGQAHDHDQRQHHGVLNRRGPVLRDEETLHFQRRALHIESSDVMSRESPRPRVAVRPRLVQKKRCFAWPALSRLRVARTDVRTQASNETLCHCGRKSNRRVARRFRMRHYAHLPSG